jgi:DNA-binding response OmpR family regulator
MLAPEHPHSTASKFRLLYLGNDLELIAALRKVLNEPEYRLVACSDREGAVLFLRSDISYDLMLIDLEWRGKAGVELASVARSLPHRKLMPILLVSATKLDRQTKTVARKAGVQECVLKTKDLDGVIKRMLGNE